METYRRKDGLISRSIKFQFHGRTYRRGLGPVSLAEYKRAERQARVEAANGTFDTPAPPRAVPTLADFAPIFLDAYAVDARPRTLEDYAARLDNHLHRWLGSIRLDAITPRVLDDYRTKRRQEGAAPRSINGELTTLSSLLAKAVTRGELPAALKPKMPWMRTEERSIRVLSASEEDRLLFAATPRLRPLIRFALQTGLRRNELLHLTWADIDWSRREVVVIGTRAKSRHRRAVPLNRAALAVLRELQGQPVRHGRIFGYIWVNHLFIHAAQKAGLPGVSCHTLRHTFATRCLEADPPVNIRMLQQWLGHASLAVTQRYLHPTQAYEREAIERLGEPSSHAQSSPSA